MKKINISTLNLILLGLYLLIYIIPLGAYRIEMTPCYHHVYGIGDNRLNIMIQVGLACVCALISLYFWKKWLTVMASVIQYGLMCICVKDFFGVLEVINKSEKGILLVQLVGILICAVAAIVNLVIIALATIDRDKMNTELHNEKNSISSKNQSFRKTIVITSYIMNVALIMLFYWMVSDIMNWKFIGQEIIKISVGIIIPMSVILFCYFRKWIIKGKWIRLSIGYICIYLLLAYEIYVTRYSLIFTNIYLDEKMKWVIVIFSGISMLFVVEMLLCLLVEKVLVTKEE